VIIPELNNGQLIKIIRDEYLVDAKGYNKIMGVPLTKGELVDEIGQYYKKEVHQNRSPNVKSFGAFFL